MIECKLIYCYGYFSLEKDPETVRGILQYEQLREQRKQKPPVREKEHKMEPSRCKMCGELLLQRTEGKREDQENTTPVVSPSEIQSDTADGENVRRLFAKSSSGHRKPSSSS